MNIDDINIIGIDMPEDKWLMMSQGDELREVLSAMSAYYTVPDIKPPESFDQAMENNEAFIEERANRIRAIMSLASSGFHVPFKTICEALGFDYDQIQEDLRVENNEELNDMEDYMVLINEVKNNNNLEFESFCVVNNLTYDITLFDIADGVRRSGGMSFRKSFHIPSGTREVNLKDKRYDVSDDMIINSKDLWREIANDGLILTQVSTRTKSDVVENKKPKKKAKETTSITEDMMNFLLK